MEDRKTLFSVIVVSSCVKLFFCGILIGDSDLRGRVKFPTGGDVQVQHEVDN
jgi:hypothetical protein